MSEAATPAAPAPNLGSPVGENVARVRLSTDTLVDGVDDAEFDSPVEAGDELDAMLADANGERTKPATKPSKPKAKPEPVPEEEPAEDAEFADDAEQTEEEPEDVLPKGKGTKENPLTVKDLPEDRFIKVKVDGKEETIDLRDLANGYIRTQKFDRVVSKADAVMKEAFEYAQAAVEERKTFRTRVNETFSNPEQLHEIMTEHYPEALRQLALIEAQRFAEEKANPGIVEQRRLAREQQRLAAERQRFEEERQTHERTRQETEQMRAFQAAVKPGYEAGMKEAGLLGQKPSPELQRTVKALLKVEREEGNTVDADAVRRAVVRAAKLLDIPSVQTRRPAPAPASPPRAAPAQRQQPGKQKDFSQMSHGARLRDPDWILSLGR